MLVLVPKNERYLFSWNTAIRLHSIRKFAEKYFWRNLCYGRSSSFQVSQITQLFPIQDFKRGSPFREEWINILHHQQFYLQQSKKRIFSWRQRIETSDLGKKPPASGQTPYSIISILFIPYLYLRSLVNAFSLLIAKNFSILFLHFPFISMDSDLICNPDNKYIYTHYG